METGLLSPNISAATGGFSLAKIKDLINVSFPGRQAKVIASQEGWTEVDETWAYSSGVIVTVASDATTRFQVLDRIKFTQNGATKYFWVSSVTATALTLYSLPGIAVEDTATYPITDISYSRYPVPFGFPSGLSVLYDPFLGGWSRIDETWAYASATSVTVTADATNRFQVGDKIKFTQHDTVKFFYVVTVAATTLTLTAGNVSSVETTGGGTPYPITEIYVSREERPFGFPQVFDWTPVFTGFSVDPSDVVARFSMDGILVNCNVHIGTNGTSNSAEFYLTPPVPMNTTYFRGVYCWTQTDNGSALSTPSRALARGPSNVIRLDKVASAANGWTASGAKGASFSELIYEAAI